MEKSKFKFSVAANPTPCSPSTIATIFVDGNERGFILKGRENRYSPQGCLYSAQYYENKDGTGKTRRSSAVYNPRSGRNEFKTIGEAMAAFRMWYEDRGAAYYAQVDDDRTPVPAPDGLTPYLIGKMLGMADWRHVQTVLNPMGEGNHSEIVHSCIRKYLKGYRKKSGLWLYEAAHHGEEYLDCITMEDDMAKKLEGECIRVVSDNFGTFETFKCYDMVVMCPPAFPAHLGEDWLLKTTALLKKCGGGQVLCLFDAELFEAYKGHPQFRVALECMNARVMYLYKRHRNDVRRDKPVYVAIHGIVSATVVNGHDTLQKRLYGCHSGDVCGEMPQRGTDKLLWELNFVDAFNREAEIGYAFMDTFEDVSSYFKTTANGLTRPIFELQLGGIAYEEADRYARNEFLEALRNKYWRLFLHQAVLTQNMTGYMNEAYNNKLSQMKGYDISLYTINRVLREMSLELHDAVVDSIVKSFTDLSGYLRYRDTYSETNVNYYTGWDGKTAVALQFPKLTVDINGYSGWHSTYLNATRIGAAVTDIEQVLRLLDSGETPDIKSAYEVAENAARCNERKMDFTWFSGTFFKRGTCTIKFHPEAKILIDRLNIFVGLHNGWLPSCYGKKPYEDLTQKEKAVIDGFQSREEYDKVYANPDAYIIENFNLAIMEPEGK